jgi:protein TonB
VVSAGTSVAAYAAVAGVIFMLVGSGAAAPVARKVQVIFRPPPPVEEAPPAPRRTPPVTKKTKVVESEALPPPAPLVAPLETPLEKPAEVEPTGEPVLVASAGGSGSSGGAWTGSASQPIHLPEAAVPPERLEIGSEPQYPEEARRAGREGLVILKIIIDEEGRVTEVDVLRGGEPFASAAVRAVRTWRYRPATLAGTPISIYRVVKVPFRLRS